MKEILIGTSNEGKAKLYQQLMSKIFSDVRAVIPAERGIDIRVEETGMTFEDNAATKARAWARSAGMPAISVDGGMMIDALGGAPGILTHRWAGENTTDEEKIAFLLDKMHDVPLTKRKVTWREVAAVAKPNGEVLLESAEDHGIILEKPVPVDNEWRGLWVLPVWYVPAHGKPWLHCTSEERDQTDSTNQVLRKLGSKLRKFLA